MEATGTALVVPYQKVTPYCTPNYAEFPLSTSVNSSERTGVCSIMTFDKGGLPLGNVIIE